MRQNRPKRIYEISANKTLKQCSKTTTVILYTLIDVFQQRVYMCVTATTASESFWLEVLHLKQAKQQTYVCLLLKSLSWVQDKIT